MRRYMRGRVRQGGRAKSVYESWPWRRSAAIAGRAASRARTAPQGSQMTDGYYWKGTKLVEIRISQQPALTKSTQNVADVRQLYDHKDEDIQTSNNIIRQQSYWKVYPA
eukprot:2261787-Pleurochrysis_carterae.AAC.1